MSCQIQSIQEKIFLWYQAHGRKHLPWKRDSVYYIWLSEIMLQQTQVQTVLPYFHRFIHHFPNLASLASGDINLVLRCWAGLGYYNRAHNLHKTAQIIMDLYQGVFPSQEKILLSLPGIGKNTAAAIMVFAFHAPATVLDGNIKRVLKRLYVCSPDPKALEALAKMHTPSHNIAEYTQAMMDIGALICTHRLPTCEQCPLQEDCLSTQNKEEYLSPINIPRQRISKKERFFFIRNAQNELCIAQRTERLWRGLWHVPHTTLEEDYAKVLPPEYIQTISVLPVVKHSFTHFDLYIHPVLCHIQAYEIPSYQWIPISNCEQYAFPAPIWKLISQLFL